MVSMKMKIVLALVLCVTGATFWAASPEQKYLISGNLQDLPSKTQSSVVKVTIKNDAPFDIYCVWCKGGTKNKMLTVTANTEKTISIKKDKIALKPMTLKFTFAKEQNNVEKITCKKMSDAEKTKHPMVEEVVLSYAPSCEKDEITLTLKEHLPAKQGFVVEYPTQGFNCPTLSQRAQKTLKNVQEKTGQAVSKIKKIGKSDTSGKSTSGNRALTSGEMKLLMELK